MILFCFYRKRVILVQPGFSRLHNFFEIGYPPECPARDSPNGAWPFSTETDGVLADEHCEIISIFVEVVNG